MTEKQITQWLQDHNVKYYKITEVDNRLCVEVLQSLDLYNKELTELPFQLSTIHGNLDLSYNRLRSWKNAPHTVKGDVNVDYNRLTSLEGAPRFIGGDLALIKNELTKLENFPTQVMGHINLSKNQLISLIGLPITIKSLDCSENKLTSLEGMAQNIKNNLDISNNQLQNLNYLPELLGGYLSAYRTRKTATYQENIETQQEIEDLNKHYRQKQKIVEEKVSLNKNLEENFLATPKNQKLIKI